MKHSGVGWRKWRSCLLSDRFGLWDPTRYLLIVKTFQRVIGDETRIQTLNREGRLPMDVVACVGGGSNAIGMFSGFLDEEEVHLHGVEAAEKACPPDCMPLRSTKGRPASCTACTVICRMNTARCCRPIPFQPDWITPGLGRACVPAQDLPGALYVGDRPRSIGSGENPLPDGGDFACVGVGACRLGRDPVGQTTGFSGFDCDLFIRPRG